MVGPVHQISRKSTVRFEVIIGGHRQMDRHAHTDRQAGDLISPISFFESRQKKLLRRYTVPIYSKVL
jgi:hypothetical protein